MGLESLLTLPCTLSLPLSTTVWLDTPDIIPMSTARGRLRPSPSTDTSPEFPLMHHAGIHHGVVGYSGYHPYVYGKREAEAEPLLRLHCRSCSLRAPRWYRRSHWSRTRCRRDWIRTCHSLLQRRCLHQRRWCPGSLLRGEGAGECLMTRTSVTNKRTPWKKKKKKKKKKKYSALI